MSLPTSNVVWCGHPASLHVLYPEFRFLLGCQVLVSVGLLVVPVGSGPGSDLIEPRLGLTVVLAFPPSGVRALAIALLLWMLSRPQVLRQSF